MTKRKALPPVKEFQSLARTPASDFESLDLLPPKQAKQRTDDLLRNLLNSPPDPRVGKSPKPAKQRKA